jgi:hypothetical protein
MATKQKDKSGSKPRQRSRKAERPSEKLDQVQSPKLDPEMEEQIIPEVIATEAVALDEVAVDAAPAEFAPSEISVPAEHPSDAEGIPAISPAVESAVIAMEAAPSVESAAPADPALIGIHSIANAYRNYANKSLEQTGSFVEKLMSVRSFDRATEVQIEFARQAYASFITESQNICELYSRLTGQIFGSWPAFAMSARAK